MTGNDCIGAGAGAGGGGGGGRVWNALALNEPGGRERAPRTAAAFEDEVGAIRCEYATVAPPDVDAGAGESESIGGKKVLADRPCVTHGKSVDHLERREFRIVDSHPSHSDSHQPTRLAVPRA